MALLVGFGAQVNAILVAQVIPHGVVGVMAGAHGVYVEAFHDGEVFNHAFACHNIAFVRIHFVSVGTFDEHGLSVNEQLCIFNFYLAETYFYGYRLNLSITLFYSGYKRVEVWRLGCPLLCVRHVKL